MANEKIVIVAGKRTPFGSFGGSFKHLTATDLSVLAATEALKQSKIPFTELGHVIFGNVQQTSADAAYLARHVALRCGLPVSTPAVTLNRLCGSGFEAIADGMRRLLLKEAKAVLVGGSESMSQAPYVLRSGRFGYRLNHAEVEDSLMSGLYDSYAKLPMALTAEKLGEQYKISRAETDAFALRSQQLAEEAYGKGHFQDEIIPVEVPGKDGPKKISKDEHIRPEANLESMAKLKPVFKKDGLVTAGNASGMVDGACALVLTTESFAKQVGAPILGELLATSVAGCDPTIMGIGPVPASQKLLSQTEKSIKDIALVEINEAFAAQVLSVNKELQIPENKLNVDGGAISIGHPLGASGARLVTHLLYRLKKTSGGLGLATACIGGGQGMSVLVRV